MPRRERAKTIFEAIRNSAGSTLEDFAPEDDDKERTVALPGSPEKISVLARRVMEGVELHHPKDVRNYEDAAEAGYVQADKRDQE